MFSFGKKKKKPKTQKEKKPKVPPFPDATNWRDDTRLVKIIEYFEKYPHENGIQAFERIITDLGEYTPAYAAPDYISFREVLKKSKILDGREMTSNLKKFLAYIDSEIKYQEKAMNKWYKSHMNEQDEPSYKF
tara:strand:- start:120 stop:518 length:399 start_codon:yes stop_codon:yes gene_type:complete